MNAVIKVQRPISSNMPDAPWLVYAEGKQATQMIPGSEIPKAVKDAMKKDLKGYFDGTFTRGTGWAIGARVADQDW